MKVPELLTSKTLAEEFVKLLCDPYPSVTKVMESARRLGIDRSVPMMIIVFELGFRNAVDNMPPKICPYAKRNDLKGAIIAALEELYERESSDVAA